MHQVCFGQFAQLRTGGDLDPDTLAAVSAGAGASVVDTLALRRSKAEIRFVSFVMVIVVVFCVGC